jgi:GntR family transcriptional regulator
VISLDFHSRVPIYRQIEDSIIEMILLGVFPEGSQLPSVRNLAVELGTNPNTIQKAYQELESQGVIVSVTGRGSFVQGQAAAREVLRRKAFRTLEAAVREASLAGLTREEMAAVLEGAGVSDAAGTEKEVDAP